MGMKSKDISKGEAKIQRKRLGLEQRINEKVFETTENANKYQAKAVEDLNQGLGLLSSYIDKRIQSQRSIADTYEGLNRTGIPSLREQAKAGASFILDEFSKFNATR